MHCQPPPAIALYRAFAAIAILPSIRVAHANMSCSAPIGLSGHRDVYVPRDARQVVLQASRRASDSDHVNKSERSEGSAYRSPFYTGRSAFLPSSGSGLRLGRAELATPKTIFLCRHGLSEWNNNSRIQGNTNESKVSIGARIARSYSTNLARESGDNLTEFLKFAKDSKDSVHMFSLCCSLRRQARHKLCGARPRLQTSHLTRALRPA